MEIDRQRLPQDSAALRQMVMIRLEELDAKERRLRQVQHRLEQWLRWRYGPKRERVDENQLFLFAAGMVNSGQASLPAAEDAPPTPPAARAKPKSHGRQRLPDSLERRRVVYDLGEHQRQCPLCQSELERIGGGQDRGGSRRDSTVVHVDFRSRPAQ